MLLVLGLNNTRLLLLHDYLLYMCLETQEVLVICIQICMMVGTFLWGLDVVKAIWVPLDKLILICTHDLTVLLRDSDLFWINKDVFSVFLLTTVPFIAGTCFTNILHILPRQLL